MNNPLLTVVIPVYNVEKYLRRCLESVCAQTYTNLEIICVDDGSTDGSPSILAEFAARDSRVKVITQQNSGQAQARNNALRVATGDWVIGLDSDDFLQPDCYEEVMKHVDGYDLVCFDARATKEDGTPLKVLHEVGVPYGEPVEDKTLLVSLNLPGFWNKVWKMDIIREHDINFPPGTWYQDASFFYKYLPMAKRALFVPIVGYNYVQREGSVMWNSARKSRRGYDFLRISRDTYDFYAKNCLLDTHLNLLLWIFRRNYTSAERVLPDSEHAELHKKMADEIASLPEKSEDFRKALSDVLATTPSWLAPFYSRTAEKQAYKVFGLPVLVVKTTPQQTLVPQKSLSFSLRLLGVPVFAIRHKTDGCTVSILGIKVRVKK